MTFLFQAITIPLIYSLIFIEIQKIYTKKKSPLFKALILCQKSWTSMDKENQNLLYVTHCALRKLQEIFLFGWKVSFSAFLWELFSSNALVVGRARRNVPSLYYVSIFLDFYLTHPPKHKYNTYSLYICLQELRIISFSIVNIIENSQSFMAF